MDFFTKVSIPPSDFQLGYSSRIFFIGSCFATNISEKFAQRKFSILTNPLGVVYNPLSIENQFRRISESKNGPAFTDSDVFSDGESWMSWDAHGSLSVKENQTDFTAREKCLTGLNSATYNAYKFITDCDCLFITLGTAFVYFLKETGRAVSNCHRQPSQLFDRRLISVEEASQSLQNTIDSIRRINKDAPIVFTVSPLRHASDGAHGNNISKSTLLLAIERICGGSQGNLNKQGVHYFPSFEIVMDELRDYRFYNSDLIHLSETAENYIFERMVETFCNRQTIADIKRVEKFMKSANHRIIDAESKQGKAFLESLKKESRELEEQIPGLKLDLDSTLLV